MKPNIRCLGLLITLITFEVLGQKSCRDCIVYTSCTKASNLVNTQRDEAAKKKFSEAFCGFDEQHKFRVCCSDFDDNETMIKKNKQISAGEETCRDCTVYTSCPKAAVMVKNSRDENTSNKFKKAFCGYNEQDKFMVCCSEFDNVNVNFRNDFDDEPAEIKHKTESVENHPNKVLLPTECGDINGGRVFGGEIAAMYEFPWMALLSYTTRNGLEFQCGATIINSRYILTAAHCIVGQNLVGVRLGEYNINTKTDCSGKDELYFCESHLQDIAVESIVSHENYTSRPATNDIALIRVDTDIDFSHKNIEAICLPISSNLRNKELFGKTGVVTGWGVTEFREKSSILRKVEIPIKTEKICSDYYTRNLKSPYIQRNVFCAGEIDKDSCNGDSGGPLQIEEIYDGVHRYVQYGIVSHGPVQCGSQFPGVYTDVTKYMGWILDNIRK